MPIVDNARRPTRTDERLTPVCSAEGALGWQAIAGAEFATLEALAHVLDDRLGGAGVGAARLAPAIGVRWQIERARAEVSPASASRRTPVIPGPCCMPLLYHKCDARDTRRACQASGMCRRCARRTAS